MAMMMLIPAISGPPGLYVGNKQSNLYTTRVSFHFFVSFQTLLEIAQWWIMRNISPNAIIEENTFPKEEKFSLLLRLRYSN
jgi:hypothetical protein